MFFKIRYPPGDKVYHMFIILSFSVLIVRDKQDISP